MIAKENSSKKWDRIVQKTIYLLATWRNENECLRVMLQYVVPRDINDVFLGDATNVSFDLRLKIGMHLNLQSLKVVMLLMKKENLKRILVLRL